MKRLLVLFMVFALLATFAACGGNKDDTDSNKSKDKNDVSQSSDTPDTDSSEPSVSETETDPVTTEPEDLALAEKIQEFIDSQKDGIDAVKESMADTMVIDCYREGKSVVMEYKYVHDTTVTAESLENSIESASGNTYKQMYDALKDYTGDDSVSIVLRYLNTDGTLILDKVFDKDYVPKNNTDTLTPDNFASLEDFVMSEYFQTLMTAQSSNEVKVSVSAKDDHTVVITYTYTPDLSDDVKSILAQSWSASMEQTAPSSMASMKSMIEGLVEIDNVVIENRLVDNQGDLISEYIYE